MTRRSNQLNSNKDLAIGVFDSGMGGLTVLRALRDKLPQESFVYLGDTARLPYGTKSPDTVKQYAMQMAKILVERRIKALVIACNTATTAALPHLQSMLTDIPVLGVVAPGAAAAVSATKNHRIAVLATETTIASRAYHDLIIKNLPEAVVSSRACSVLVALAEEGMVTNAVAREALKHYLDDFSDEDAVLLGCTHFPVFKPLLSSLLPKDVAIVDSAQATAISLCELLQNQNLHNDNLIVPPRVNYLVTDSINRFQKVGEIFLGEQLSLSDIELIDAMG
ncbi:TPA: glutamate racemase [Legionella pneumophila subsp. pneumophila]|uniref:glutamate racemase n=1 Tax=Legionella sp. PATHC039 TaxID=2992042 RepID=UPI001A204C73|nr:glutamate racemase [Legionella sp. PATHC039]MCW8394219.1 glutamate racemase [Legionella sp. PATHC039]HAT8857567.1 glutamate racemase [Legionella pneumophila subsp. pneumophila]HAT9651411.1 glutamate racemase [Legionella pneumophila subsp. pneumophila]HAT9919130.1 glutamate racemase [Legionella pneumophila subsp. pneumophila]